jgi:glycosyltransferase involved in cell wall biosynthesis
MSEAKDNSGKKVITYPEISVIIPFHGLLDDLSNCLSGLKNQKTKLCFEIFIVESGTEYNFRDISNLFPSVNWISSETLLFPGEARNLGASKATSDILAFIDSDCVPVSNWITEAHSKIKSGLEIVIGPILNLNSFQPISTADNHLQFVDFQKHRPSTNINHFPGCNFVITKKLFNEADGFLENLKVGEDVLFSQAAIKKCNNKIYFNKKLIVKHQGRNNIRQFIEHNRAFGYYRGYLSLKINVQSNKIRSNYLYSIIFGFKRLMYICLRTLQWNPVGLFTIFLYFPLIIIGLYAWTKGFYNGNNQSIKN